MGSGLGFGLGFGFGFGLGLDAPDGPHVDGGRVVLVLDEEFRRAVPIRELQGRYRGDTGEM